MVNYDPDSGLTTPEVLKAVVRERENKAGIYGTVIRCGRLAVASPSTSRRPLDSECIRRTGDEA